MLLWGIGRLLIAGLLKGGGDEGEGSLRERKGEGEEENGRWMRVEGRGNLGRSERKVGGRKGVIEESGGDGGAGGLR